ncbi:hypothetical protein CFOL_v3_16173 [Cephalotus follicularis]|uniref:Uncharacterized protein n=1 Tax=Cephalotus follicularis TaxID=3775 RepID=A0A1Q3BXE3_CEPFO|nr:hypothetical protein CFOL_v3_16173 [Cephalotus follicularis]
MWIIDLHDIKLIFLGLLLGFLSVVRVLHYCTGLAQPTKTI